MPGKSSIEWCTDTLNPTVGCTHVSAGCDSCYAKTLHDQRHNAWLAGNMPNAPVQYHKPFTELQMIPERLDIPLRWTKPRRIFVNSVSDLFHPRVPTEFIDRMVAVFALAPHHVFQVLTKRPRRMQQYFSDPALYGRVLEAAIGFRCKFPKLISVPISDPVTHPLPNLWLGTSVENQEAAYRLDALVKTPAAVRFVSAEPLIGPLNLARWLPPRCWQCKGEGVVWESSLLYAVPDEPVPCPRCDGGRLKAEPSPLHWIIAGGESGPGYRPAEVFWFSALADQCAAANVPFFMKQDSGHRSGQQGRIPDDLWALKQMPEVGR